MKCFYFLLLLTLKLTCKDLNEGIMTHYFKFFGHRFNVMGSTVTEYLGIPYTYPPMNSYRFKASVEIKKREEILNYYAVHLAESCPQIVKITGFAPYDESHPKIGNKENCLKLNMWVPSSNDSVPVLVFFHGGIFNRGSASVDKFNGSVLAATTNSIVITANYRLGFFGFAHLKSGVIPGNMGLLDQQVLLKWIHKTIENFGGDKDRVTLFGSSSGSSCVAAHLFSEESKPYFKRAIMSSGSITHLMSTVTPEIADTNTRNVSVKVGCIDSIDQTKKSDEEILKCLQNKTVEELLKAAVQVKSPKQLPTPFSFFPIDNDTVFFKGNFKQKQKSQNFNKNVDLIIGRTADEGTYFMTRGFTNNSKFGCFFYPHKPVDDPENSCNMSEANFKTLVFFGGSMFKLNTTEIAKLTEIYYDSATTYTNRSIRFLSDILFDCDLSKFGIDYSNISEKNVYFYEHVRRSPINKWPSWTGASHGDDLLDIFGMPFRHPEKYPADILENEQEYSKNVMMAIGKFMKDGNLPEKWKKGTGKDPDALAFDGKLKFDSNLNFTKFRPPTCNKVDSLLMQSIMWKMKQMALAQSKKQTGVIL